MMYIRPQELITESLYPLANIKDVRDKRMMPENVTQACVLLEGERIENV